MNIIFLDIDGVLNSSRVYASGFTRPYDWDGCYLHKEAAKFDPIAVGLINQLAKKADAKIVISSAWRQDHSVVDLRALLTIGRLAVERIIDKTIHMHGDQRGLEVKEWLDRHDVDKYVIFDDGCDFLPGQMLIRTDNDDGFVWRHYKQACEVFGIEP